MNLLERAVYRMVRDNEPLKKRLKVLYQGLCDLRPVPGVETRLPLSCRPGYFFGFHDKTPFSPGDRQLLAHRELIPLRMPRPDDAVEVGVFEGEGWRTWRPLATTRAWTWHQGAMLQWVGATDRLLFNDCIAGRHVARICTVAGREEAVLGWPVAAVSPDGQWGAGYSFVRAGRGMPGYGYAGGNDALAGEATPAADGLRMVNLTTGTSRLALSLEQLTRLEPEPSMQGAHHWVTHCLFSPGGRRLLFMHRWVQLETHRRWTRLLACDPDGGGVHLFPTDRMVSHVAWRDEEWVLAYARTRRHDNAYQLFRDGSEEYHRLSDMDSDGHPMFDPTRRWVVTDTYPDAFRRQTLILFDTAERVRYDMARFRVPRRFFGSRIEDHWMVDLHPRWSRDGRTVCFDSGHGGVRSLCTMPIEPAPDALAVSALRVRREPA